MLRSVICCRSFPFDSPVIQAGDACFSRRRCCWCRPSMRTSPFWGEALSREKTANEAVFLFLKSKKKTAKGNQTIIGKRNNDDGDIVYYMYVLLLPQYVVLPDGDNFVCLFFEMFLLLFVVIAWVNMLLPALLDHLGTGRCQVYGGISLLRLCWARRLLMVFGGWPYLT